LIIIHLLIAAESTVSQDSVFENDDSEDGSEMRAQWAVSEDPDAAKLIHYIEKREDFSVVFSAQLAKHLEYKEKYPGVAARELQKKGY
jgi:hypothetical protein